MSNECEGKELYESTNVAAQDVYILTEKERRRYILLFEDYIRRKKYFKCRASRPSWDRVRSAP